MKIVIAPNALKGSLTAAQAAESIADGIRRAIPDAELVLQPVTDGGDGFIDVLQQALQATPQHYTVTGPVGSQLEASYLLSKDKHTAVIEMAAAAGLALLRPDQLAPMTSNTQGVGELILDAINKGAVNIILGIGGSATNDGGMGMAQALGVQFLDKRAKPLTPGGATLIDIATIDTSSLDPRIKQTSVQVICDVDNPLLGKRGAANFFGPQKGASPEQIQQLEAGLAHLSALIHKQLGIEVSTRPGAGAAGGLGAGTMAFLDAQLQPGAGSVLKLLDFDTMLTGADLVITAEGQLDSQTAFGKAPSEVARHAKNAGIPCIAITGRLNESIENLATIGITSVYSICSDSISTADAMKNAAKYIKATATQAINNFCAGRKAGVFYFE